MKTCVNCKTYNVVLVADKSQPSQYMPVAEQSDSDTYTRFTHSHPVVETDHCYYCTKKLNGQIGALRTYGLSYAADQKDR